MAIYNLFGTWHFLKCWDELCLLPQIRRCVPACCDEASVCLNVFSTRKEYERLALLSVWQKVLRSVHSLSLHGWVGIICLLDPVGHWHS